MRQGFVEEIIPQFLPANAVIDHLQETVEPRRHRQHFGERCCRIDAVEQRHRQFRVLADVGGNAILAHPARLFALDRRRHQIVGHDPPRNNQRRFPAEVKGIAARLTPKRIAAADMLAHAARGVLDNAVIRQMRQKSRLPPRAPAIGAAFIAQEGGCGEPSVGIVA